MPGLSHRKTVSVEEDLRLTRCHHPPAKNWGTTQSGCQCRMDMPSKLLLLLLLLNWPYTHDSERRRNTLVVFCCLGCRWRSLCRAFSVLISVCQNQSIYWLWRPPLKRQYSPNSTWLVTHDTHDIVVTWCERPIEIRVWWVGWWHPMAHG